MTGYRFAALGPFHVPTGMYRKRRVVDFTTARDYVFEQAHEQAQRKLGEDNITAAVGCYIFALKPSGGQVIWPYYVGQACRQTLHQRLFQKIDKPKNYNEILNEYKKATAYVYLLPLLTPSGRLAKLGANQKMINSAEFALIGMALRVNYSLWNIKHRAGIESFSIDGTPQSDRRDTLEALSVRRMLGFAKGAPKGTRLGQLRPDPQDGDFGGGNELAESLIDDRQLEAD
jgi:hypothetical protein